MVGEKPYSGGGPEVLVEGMAWLWGRGGCTRKGLGGGVGRGVSRRGGDVKGGVRELRSLKQL